MARTKQAGSNMQSSPAGRPVRSRAKKSHGRDETARLFDEVQRLRSDFDKYAERTVKDLEASRLEMQSLSRRIHHLEQLVRHNANAGTSTVSVQARPASSKSLFTFLGRPTLPVDQQSSASRA
jgi:hypothetical protein